MSWVLQLHLDDIGQLVQESLQTGPQKGLMGNETVARFPDFPADNRSSPSKTFASFFTVRK